MTLYDIFNEPNDDNIEENKDSSIVQDFKDYITIRNDIHHSPNMSPSKPINNGEVSE